MYDVIITGAGPAGSVAAHGCAKKGLRVLLLDRETFPRRKPCGGAVAERVLGLLDIALPGHLMERECFGAVLRFRGHRVTVRSDQRIAFLTSRDRFDEYLAEQAAAAGATFRQGEAVERVAVHRETVEVVTARSAYTASYLIGADGVHSIVARAVRPPLPRHEMAFALVSSVPAGNAGDADPGDGLLDMHFGIAPLGYGWDFPHSHYRSVGVMGHASRFVDPQAVLSSYAASQRCGLEVVRGHFIPFGGIRRPVIAGRIALAGDAAGFGDAFSGEGIVHAIHSGKLAAEAVVRAVAGGEGPAALPAYAEVAHERITLELRAALNLARLVDRFPRLSLSLFFRQEEPVRRYLDIPAGRMDYRTFWRWLVTQVPGALAANLFGRKYRRG